MVRATVVRLAGCQPPQLRDRVGDTAARVEIIEGFGQGRITCIERTQGGADLT